MSYNLNKLQKFEKNLLICERKSTEIENIYSYKDVIEETNKCLTYFKEFHVTAHVGIAVDLKEHSAATCVLLLGILNYGCHFYCLNIEETKNVETYLKLSGVKYVISAKYLELDNISQFQRNEIEILKLCYTIATSGSTGLPKMVHVPYECIEQNIKSLSDLLNIQHNDLIFLGSPPTFDPFVVEFFISIENGAGILITSKEIRLQPQQLQKVMFPDISTSRQGVTLYQTTPSLFRLFGKQSIQNVILSKNSSLRYLILGGEDFPCSLELKSWLPLDFLSTGKRIFNIYGITEISCWSSIFEYNAETNSIAKVRVPLGKPLDNYTSLRLLNEDGHILYHNDCKGELEIGSSIRCCFIPQCDNDISILKGKNFIYRKTGDIVERDGSGNIYYIGRTNNTIKRFGKRLCLDSLNKKVQDILNANRINFRVISLWHKETSNLIFYFVNCNHASNYKKSSVVNALKDSLENYEKPNKLFYSEILPLNHHGKVDRETILQQILLPAKSSVEIFKDFLVNTMGFELDMDKIGSYKSTTSSKRLKLPTSLSFIKAGGTSFQALTLATEISELIDENIKQIKILEMLLNENVTIQDMLEFLISCSGKSEVNKLPNESLINIEPSFNLNFLWRCDLKKCIDASPSIYEDKYVLVGSHSHLLLTVNATTGSELSRLELNDRIECSVAFVSSHLALVGCYDGFLYGFDFKNGTILWKLNVKGMIKAKPLVTKDLILVASYAEDYNIVAFNIKSLASVWSLKLGSKGIFASPVHINEESVLFCSLDGTYALIEASTGCIKWLQKLVTPVFSTPIKIQMPSDVLLVLAQVNGQISICKADDGKIISSFQAEGNIFSGLTLLCPEKKNHILIVFGCHDKNLYCLQMEHTNRKLSLFSKFRLNSAVYSTPIVISKRYILACSTKGLMMLLDIEKNTVVATTNLKAEVFSTPSCLSDTYIYIGSRDNYLYCFQLLAEK